MADVGLWISLAMTLAFLAASLLVVVWIFRTGYRLKA
jgi:ABC-2 type transport system permease protein